MNIELRWVERGGPTGKDPDGETERVLQYRERLPADMRVVQGVPNLTMACTEGGWSEWRDVPVEAQ